MSEMFDIAAFKNGVTDTAVLQIVNPVDGLPTNIKITLASVDSDRYRQASLRIQNEQLKALEKGRNKASAERLAAGSLDLLVSVTVSWEGIAENGVPLDCTPENVRRVYSELPFIREQVDDFFADRRNFFKS